MDELQVAIVWVQERTRKERPGCHYPQHFHLFLPVSLSCSVKTDIFCKGQQVSNLHESKGLKMFTCEVPKEAVYRHSQGVVTLNLLLRRYYLDWESNFCWGSKYLKGGMVRVSLEAVRGRNVLGPRGWVKKARAPCGLEELKTEDCFTGGLGREYTSEILSVYILKQSIRKETSKREDKPLWTISQAMNWSTSNYWMPAFCLAQWETLWCHWHWPVGLLIDKTGVCTSHKIVSVL